MKNKKDYNMKNNTYASITFDSPSERDKFFDSNLMDYHGLDENTMETETGCGVECSETSLDTLAEGVTAMGGKVHKTCKGKNLSDCSRYEDTHGSPCQFCQFCEYE